MDVVPPPSRGRRALQGSSYVKRGLVIGLSGRDAELVLPEAAVDLVGDPSLESANRLQLGVAGRSSTQEVVASRTGIPHLREGDPVQGGVDLAVATSVEPIALVARPDWDRCGAVVHREGGAGAEATNAGRLADELGGGDHAATLQGQQSRCQGGRSDLDLGVQLLDLGSEAPAASDELARQPRQHVRQWSELDIQRQQHVSSAEAPWRRLVAGVEFVEVPPEPVLVAGPFGDQGVAMIEEQ